MENRPEGRVNYVVERAMTGQWDVNEQGFEKPIASFQEKGDAVEYARRLAATKDDAQIRVCH